MNEDRNRLLAELKDIVSTARDRVVALRKIADALKSHGAYRWTGLYDVDPATGIVRNIVWSGPGAPEHPTFPVTRGLTGAAISERKTVNVGDVTADPRYLTAFGTTRSEIIVPIFDGEGKNVVGTIDVESERRDAFSEKVQALLEDCAEAIRPLWHLQFKREL